MATLQRVLMASAWLLAAVAIGLGGAGLVAAVDPGSNGAVRAELTAMDDALVTPMLDAIANGLTGVADDVDQLGTQARGALAATVARQPDTVDETIAAGDALLVDLEARTAALRPQLDGLPYLGSPDVALHLSPPVIARYASYVAALQSTDGLKDAWSRLTVGASAASRLSQQLADHDRIAGEAAALGRAAKYQDAIETLARAQDTINASRASRDRLVATVDVTVLDEWLSRNETYDKALAKLYDALSSVGGKVTKKVRQAIEAEQAARKRLPPDSRGLVLIMADIAQGGLNSAVVAIEAAKADLSGALEPAPAPS